jgi:GNAT superfamily N-acetyltransferase
MAGETEARVLPPARVRKGVTALLRDSTKGAYYVAELRGRVVGQLMITYEWSDWRNGNFWWIQSVYVEKRFRRKGVFKALFQHAVSLAKADPTICGLRLYVDAHNDRAQKTYGALGMSATDYQVYETDFTLG